MFKIKRKTILIMALVMVTLFSSTTLANEVLMDEGSIPLPDGWEIVNQENKEVFYKEYPFLEQIKDFALILMKTKNAEKFNNAQKNKDAEKILQNYPAYIVMKQVDLPKGNQEKLLEKPVNQMKRQVNQTYQNALFTVDEKTKIGKHPGYQINYTVGHMEFKNLFYTDGEYMIAILSTNTKQQKASKEIDNFKKNLIALY